MTKRPKCAFKDCDNPVMKSMHKNILLSICKECFDSDRIYRIVTEKMRPNQQVTRVNRLSGNLFDSAILKNCIVTNLPPCPSCGSDQTIGMTTGKQAVLCCFDCKKVFGPSDSPNNINNKPT